MSSKRKRQIGTESKICRHEISPEHGNQECNETAMGQEMERRKGKRKTTMKNAQKITSKARR